MHKNKILSTVLAVLLGVTVALSPVMQPLGVAFAEQTVSAESAAAAGQEPVSPEAIEQEGSSAEDADEDEGALAPQDSEAEPSGSTLPSSEVLSFLYIDVAEIEPGEMQNVVVALNESIGSTISSAALTIQNETGEDVATYELANSDALAALFSFDTSELGAGTYQVGSMSVVTDTGSYVIDFSDAQVRSFSISYGVSSLSLEAEESHDSVTAYTIDEEGNLVEAESVAMAVSSAQQVTSSRSRSRTSSLVIALDPGHGGYDSGAVGVNGVHEADLTWKIANYCRDELVNEYGAKVVFTRGQNENPSLKERAQRAADAGAGVLVSIHLNSTGSGAAYGSEIYVPNNHGYDTETHSVGVDLAEKIIDQLAALGLHDRGVKTRDYETGNIYDANTDGSTSKDYYGIIRESRALGIPGIIVEHAFIDNVSDYNNYLSSDAKLKALGVADATGIAQQFGLSKNLEERYAAVYDYDFYVTKYPDVADAFGGDRQATFNHFLSNGMKEARQGCASFDVLSYYNRYPDLRRAFGSDLPSYYEHYVSSGKAENRVATGCSAMTGWATSMDGIDYSSVYDPSYYLNHYADLSAAFSEKLGTVTLVDDAALLSHFVSYGMAEGRSGNEAFNVLGYYNRYPDLRQALGTNLKSYYLHYVNNGRLESRSATSCAFQGWTTSLGGTDYSAVYDGAYYYDHYVDLQKAFTVKPGQVQLIDDVALLRHFVNNGMAEGRRANASFNVTYYQYRYTDLQAAFGTDLKSYYLHYVTSGCHEGRQTDGTVPPNWSMSVSSKSIMGTSTTSAAQMARYYRSVAGESAYPASVYASKGAPTIEDFARIVYEEATAEGVRAEVVFCQAMHETGWLRFGGDVSVGQCNFAGIGATGGGAAGATFGDVRTGIRAQVQHLKAYASTEPLNNPCVDPRFHYVTRGIAPTLDDLDGRWATGNGYGSKIYSLIQELGRA
ncbi:N-acetylmuramoyl-L-alanine amidase [Olsenella sp. SW781]|uniref:N-acetylmuramoyl-L-alanine amidase n=1 Tax=Olsenella sp. SW781 TaxID=2530046 RepID=UPI00143AD0B8|nr:N-acetylmuramoyl-L-alanine amidase [Olsenella sp. SW781]